MDVAVVIPVKVRSPEEAGDLVACLGALAACDPPPAEVVVVDDGSAQPVALPPVVPPHTRVLRQDNRGPGPARNAGLHATRAPLVAFIDADVQVAPDALGRLAAHFLRGPDVAAVWATVSAVHPHGGTLSTYKLLTHRHFTLRLGAGPGPWETPHLTTMLAVVRRAPFEAVGGFSPSWDTVSVEDVELGRDLVDAGGRVLLDPTVEVSHGHRFTLRAALRNDAHKLRRLVSATLARRARGGASVQGPSATASRMRSYAASVPLGVAAVATGAVGLWPVSVALLGGLALAERDLVGFLAREAGPVFAVKVLPVIALERCTAAAAGALGLIDHARARSA